MALKRTRVPFYGKRELKLTTAARAAFRVGDIENANRLHTLVAESMRARFIAHMERGGRKPIRTA